jgi:hypothetical protein
VIPAGKEVRPGDQRRNFERSDQSNPRSSEPSGLADIAWTEPGVWRSAIAPPCPGAALSGPFISPSSRDNFEALAVRDWFVSRGGRSTMCSSTCTALVPARAEAKANERCEAPHLPAFADLERVLCRAGIDSAWRRRMMAQRPSWQSRADVAKCLLHSIRPTPCGCAPRAIGAARRARPPSLPAAR